MRAKEVMTKNPATVSMDASVVEVARLMAEKDFGFVPIVDGQGRAVGTVTDRDIVVRVIAWDRPPATTRAARAPRATSMRISSARAAAQRTRSTAAARQMTAPLAARNGLRGLAVAFALT